MAVKKWAIQRFFNEADADDSGFMTAYIKPFKREDGLGFETGLTIADCSRRIHLEFEPEGLYVDRSTGAYTAARLASAKAYLKIRRKKLAVFRESMVKFCDAMEKAYDEFEDDLNKVKPNVKVTARKS